MKKVLLGILALLLCVSCSNRKNSLYYDNLKGKVKTLKSVTYEAKYKFGEVEKGEIVSELWEHPLGRYSYGNIGLFIKHYDKKGNLELSERFDTELELESKTEYFWEKGWIMGYKTRYEDGAIEEWSCKRNKRYGEIIEETLSSEWLDYKTVRTIREDDAEMTDWVRDNEYHDEFLEGRPQQEKGSYKTIRKKGEVLQRIYYNEAGEETSTVTYGERERIMTVQNDDGSSVTFEYNDLGDVVKMVDSGEEYAFEYEYDKHDNWIKRITYKGDTPLYIEEREIEYY